MKQKQAIVVSYKESCLSPTAIKAMKDELTAAGYVAVCVPLGANADVRADMVVVELPPIRKMLPWWRRLIGATA